MDLLTSVENIDKIVNQAHQAYLHYKRKKT